MKTLTLLAAMFLTVALAGPAVGEQQASSQNSIVAPDKGGNNTVRKQFNGTLTASETYQEFGNPPILFFVNAGGNATTTTLGQFTIVYTFIVDAATGDAIGGARYIATNGDSIFTSATAVSGPSGDEFVVVERHTITGGTGRFAHAAGSFTVHRTIDESTATSSGSFHGFILLRNNHGH